MLSQSLVSSKLGDSKESPIIIDSDDNRQAVDGHRGQKNYGDNKKSTRRPQGKKAQCLSVDKGRARQQTILHIPSAQTSNILEQSASSIPPVSSTELGSSSHTGLSSIQDPDWMKIITEAWHDTQNERSNPTTREALIDLPNTVEYRSLEPSSPVGPSDSLEVKRKKRALSEGNDHHVEKRQKTSEEATRLLFRNWPVTIASVGLQGDSLQIQLDWQPTTVDEAEIQDPALRRVVRDMFIEQDGQEKWDTWVQQNTTRRRRFRSSSSARNKKSGNGP